jgi:hypothetical protein
MTPVELQAYGWASLLWHWRGGVAFPASGCCEAFPKHFVLPKQARRLGIKRAIGNFDSPPRDRARPCHARKRTENPLAFTWYLVASGVCGTIATAMMAETAPVRTGFAARILPTAIS